VEWRMFCHHGLLEPSEVRKVRNAMSNHSCQDSGGGAPPPTTLRVFGAARQARPRPRVRQPPGALGWRLACYPRSPQPSEVAGADFDAFPGFRRKPLILPTFISFYQLLPV